MSQNCYLDRRWSQQRAIATLEGAVWCVVLLPLLLFGVSVGAAVHDQLRLQQIPVSALREYAVVGQRARSDLGAVVLDVNSAELERMLGQIRSRLLLDARSRIIGGVDHLSAVACYWLYPVQGGRITSETPLRERCVKEGGVADLIAMGQPRAAYVRQLSEQRAIAHDEQRVAVVLGAAVGAEVRWMLGKDGREVVQFVHVALPHEEIGL